MILDFSVETKGAREIKGIKGIKLKLDFLYNLKKEKNINEY